MEGLHISFVNMEPGEDKGEVGGQEKGGCLGTWLTVPRGVSGQPHWTSKPS